MKIRTEKVENATFTIKYKSEIVFQAAVFVSVTNLFVVVPLHAL